ncbi:hypothetical protein ACFY8W_36530 [Streptomyces sp. NPDC012637]|uniref:hypothetical protein n=1 Tax=Streptomyces sp. NPDC012637 TaxID=3364842 RepID=UPI0036E111DC
MSSLDARLGALRGSGPPLPHTARTLGALTANPRCDRRSILDAAGIDKDALATHLGLPRPLRKSQLALDYGIAFERQVTDQGAAALVALLRQALKLAPSAATYKDVNSVGSDNDKSPLGLRHAYTSTRILSAAHGRADPCNLLDHPVLSLTVAGRQAYLEPDVIAFHDEGVFYVVEVKSFPVIHGRPDPMKAAAALTQAAAYVLALRELLTGDGLSAERVSDTVVLVNPLNFTRRPTATPYNAAKQIRHLSRHLNRLERLPALVDDLPADTTFDLQPGADGRPTRPHGELTDALATTQPHYTPACRHHCELAPHCRTEARNQGSTGFLGPTVLNDLAGIDTIATALALTDGHLNPSRDQKDTVRALRHAQRVRTDLQKGST